MMIATNECGWLRVRHLSGGRNHDRAKFVMRLVCRVVNVVERINCLSRSFRCHAVDPVVMSDVDRLVALAPLGQHCLETLLCLCLGDVCCTFVIYGELTTRR